ncbi:glycosyltransferase family 2 protein [Sphingobacterium spiritivorum]|uniref:glycosyltransferase family 2 protein n=1 Tax=Sphingobacterium spiritivorum TaxID=258 RepID=UPI003DA4A0C0
MTNKTKISLLISTYNWPEALHLCLESILLQTILPDEIVIADDGSREETREEIEKFRLRTNISIQHIWHEDNGFQLSQIRNKAISQVSNPYIIQIDGDVILHSCFIQDHLIISEQNAFITGSRVNLDENFSKKMLLRGVLPDLHTLRYKSKNILNSLHIPFLAKIFADKYKVNGRYRDFTRGCNMAYWKDDIIKVNGYNESMHGWGSEDKELVARLRNLGLKKRFLKFSGIVYHIWHPFASREKEIVNDSIYKSTVSQNKTFTANGINKYLK